MSKISEFFGLYCKNMSLNFKQAMEIQTCPYTQRICIKMRKSDPQIKIGTCSVRYQNQNVIICPFRLLEHNQIFIDCLHLLTMHEPGNELYLVPEVQIPGGHVDYFLISAKDKKIKGTEKLPFFAGVFSFQDINSTHIQKYSKTYKENAALPCNRLS